jgi:hypothetical protein
MTFSVAGYFISKPELLARPWTIIGAILTADAAILAVIYFRPYVFRLHRIAGAAAFLLLASWLARFNDAQLYWELGTIFGFSLLHSVYPLLVQRLKKVDEAALWTNVYPLAGMALMLLLLTQLPTITLVVWPIILLLDLLIIGLAFFTASLGSATGAVLLTALFTAVWIFKVPAGGSGSGTILITGLFSILFFAAGLGLFRKAVTDLEPESRARENLQKYMPAVSAVLPFILLALIVVRIHAANPSNLFALALVLSGMLLWLSHRLRDYLLSTVALSATLFLQYFWSQSDFVPERAGIALVWHLLFYAIFMAFPFLLGKAINIA